MRAPGHLPWTGAALGLKRERGALCLWACGERCWAGLLNWQGQRGTMEGEEEGPPPPGSGAEAGSDRAKVCVYTCLRVCAHHSNGHQAPGRVGSVAGLLCPLAQDLGGHCERDQVCPLGLFIAPGDQGPRLPTLPTSGGRDGARPCRWGTKSCLRQRGWASTAWHYGRGAGQLGCSSTAHTMDPTHRPR